MMNRGLTLLAVAAGALVLAVGCTLGPDPERPTTAADVVRATSMRRKPRQNRYRM